MSRYNKTIWISVMTVVVLIGCASNRAERLSREGTVESIDLYRQASGSESRKVEDIYRARHMLAAESYRDSYTRMAENELSVLFKKHPNPVIRIFVYPHLSTSDNAPVPGYMTAITLYDRDQYALPHEVLAQQGRAND